MNITSIAVPFASIILVSLALPIPPGGAQPQPPPITQTAGATRSLVLVELFTSEGCSSCPPADVLLAKLAHDQPVEGAEIVPLAFHVDYWNNLGWMDRFSSAEFTQRQKDYSAALHVNSLYTPQMIVNGRDEFVGSDEDSARTAIAKAAKTRLPAIEIQADLDGDQMKVEVKLPASIKLDRATDVLIAITEDDLQSKVARGENAGRKLTHVAVVRTLELVTRDAAGAFKSALKLGEWKRDRLRVIAFVQNRQTREVLGIAATVPAKSK